jgi:hypothetical protein
VEVDADAYEQTKGNYDLSPWRRKMQAFHTSFQDYAQADEAERPLDERDERAEASSTVPATVARGHDGYDVIICNPPYHPRPPQHSSSDHSSRYKAIAIIDVTVSQLCGESVSDCTARYWPRRAHARFSDYLSSAELLSGVARCLHKVSALALSLSLSHMRSCSLSLSHALSVRLLCRLIIAPPPGQERGQFWLFYPYLQADRFTSDAARHDLQLRSSLPRAHSRAHVPSDTDRGARSVCHRHRCDICFRRGKHLQRSILMFERTSSSSGATSTTGIPLLLT